MNKGTVLALLVVVLGGGYGLGRLVIKDKGGGATASTKTTPGGKNEPWHWEYVGSSQKEAA